jgi:hypothetical protein
MKMSKFTVKMSETLVVTTEIEANDAGEAKDKAWDMYEHGELFWMNEQTKDGDLVKIEVTGVKI